MSQKFQSPHLAGDPTVSGCGPSLEPSSRWAFRWTCVPKDGAAGVEPSIPVECIYGGVARTMTLTGHVPLPADRPAHVPVAMLDFVPQPLPMKASTRELLLAAGCVPHARDMQQPWELIVLARHNGKRWEALAGEIPATTSSTPLLDPENPLAAVPALAKALKGHRWWEVNSDFGPRAAPPDTGAAAYPVVLDNFDARAFYGVSLGRCLKPESYDSVFVSQPVEAVTPEAAVAARMLDAVKHLGGAYAHFWFRAPSAPGLLFAGGNTSGMFPEARAAGPFRAFAGEWFGQLPDDPKQPPDWIALTLRHY